MLRRAAGMWCSRRGTPSGPISDHYRASFIEYWQKLGDQIGETATPIPVPSAAAATRTRADKIRPELVRGITVLDVNIVYQRLAIPEEQTIDTVIGQIFLFTMGRSNNRWLAPMQQLC